jgi:hypothetical protein
VRASDFRAHFIPIKGHIRTKGIFNSSLHKAQHSFIHPILVKGYKPFSGLYEILQFQITSYTDWFLKVIIGYKSLGVLHLEQSSSVLEVPLVFNKQLIPQIAPYESLNGVRFPTMVRVGRPCRHNNPIQLIKEIVLH